MNIDVMAQASIPKGLNLLGTGDCLLPAWQNEITMHLTWLEDQSLFLHEPSGIHFVLQTEIEDSSSVHHLLLLPDLDATGQLFEHLQRYSSNIDSKWGGRPRVDLGAAEIAGLVHDVGGLIGPAHAFTPFRSVFRTGGFDSLEECYGAIESADFVELGLSADTEMADRISELRKLSFLTNSDAHSPTPNSMGREFTQFNLPELSFDALKDAIRHPEREQIVLNVGFDPKLGKYYRSFCRKCRRRIEFTDNVNATSYSDSHILFPTELEDETLVEISKKKIRCPVAGCGALFQLGVLDRVALLADSLEAQSPSWRPKYIHSVPLTEMIRSVLGLKSACSKRVLKLYSDLTLRLGNEIQILVNTPISRIEEINKELAATVETYRSGELVLEAGGGGTYGHIKGKLE